MEWVKNAIDVLSSIHSIDSSCYTGHTQKNGAVSKVNKICISYPTPAQHTLSAVGTDQVSKVVSAGGGFLCAPF
jgi:hypothetical protein